jgi:hypothetical protein
MRRDAGDKERLKALVDGREWAPLGTTGAGEGSEETQEHSSGDEETPADAGVSDSAPGRIRTCGLSLRRRALYPLSYGRFDLQISYDAAALTPGS